MQDAGRDWRAPGQHTRCPAHGRPVSRRGCWRRQAGCNRQWRAAVLPGQGRDCCAGRALPQTLANADRVPPSPRTLHHPSFLSLSPRPFACLLVAAGGLNGEHLLLQAGDQRGAVGHLPAQLVHLRRLGCQLRPCLGLRTRGLSDTRLAHTCGCLGITDKVDHLRLGLHTRVVSDMSLSACGLAYAHGRCQETSLTTPILPRAHGCCQSFGSCTACSPAHALACGKACHLCCAPHWQQPCLDAGRPTCPSRGRADCWQGAPGRGGCHSGGGSGRLSAALVRRLPRGSRARPGPSPPPPAAGAAAPGPAQQFKTFARVSSQPASLADETFAVGINTQPVCNRPDHQASEQTSVANVQGAPAPAPARPAARRPGLPGGRWPGAGARTPPAGWRATPSM